MPGLAQPPPVTLQDGRIGGNGAAVCNLGYGDIFQDLIFDGADWQNYGTDNHPIIRDNRFIHGAGVSHLQDNTVTVEDNQFLAGPTDKTAISTYVYVAGVFSGNIITGYGVGLDLGDFGGVFSRIVTNNRIFGAGIGIYVEAYSGALGTISGNQVAGDSGDGILIGPAFGNPQGMISGNIAVGNGGNGIEAQSPGGAVTFTDNVAIGNAGYGIVAPAGAVDGGGNRASGNGSTPQCVNLVCSN
jgi:Right handed beta helix region